MPDVLSASQLADERAAHRAELAVAIDQRDAWAGRYTDLAAAVLEGVYLNYDVKDDSGGSSFLCTCEHDGDGWPHEEWCGKLLLSMLGTEG